MNDSISNGIDEEACIWRYITARFFHDSSNTTDSLKVLEDCVRNDNKNAAFWCSLSVIKYEVNEIENALRYAKNAIDVDDSIPEVLHNFAVLLEKVDRGAEAIPYYEKLQCISKYEEFVRKRLDWIQGRSQNPQDSLINRVLNLKHPDHIIKGSLKIFKPNKSMINKEIKESLAVLNSKKMNYQAKSPDRTVRFLNIASSHGSIESKSRGEYSVPLNKEAQKESDIQGIFKNTTKSRFTMSYLCRWEE